MWIWRREAGCGVLVHQPVSPRTPRLRTSDFGLRRPLSLVGSRMSDVRSRLSPGVAGMWTMVALAAFLGVAALVMDVGRLILAAQRAQNVADSAALAAGGNLPYELAARATAATTVQANNSGAGWQVQCEDSDIVFYDAGDTVPGYEELGLWACGMEVTTHVPIQYTFARLVGIEGGTANRLATVVRGPVRGVPIATMWIADTDDLEYGVRQQLLMADGPHYAGIPGSFGFLQSPEGCTASFFDLLQGYNLTRDDIESSFVDIGDSVYAETGEMVGHWRKALEQDLGRARLERCTTGKWANDTWVDWQFHADNPRIMLIPLVTYVGGTGANAEFRIEKFGAFWIEEVNQGQRKIWGRFLQYDLPGGDLDVAAIRESGIFATKLVR
jgi:hypothetical protein